MDVVHALLMATWVIGLPLLFVRRWPRLTHAYGVYAITFILMSQLSHLALGECFLTTISRELWERSFASGVPPSDSSEWFTVRLAKWVFDMSPTHRAVVIFTELLILLTVVGELFVLRRSSGRPFAAKRVEQPRAHIPKGYVSGNSSRRRTPTSIGVTARVSSNHKYSSNCSGKLA